MVGGVPKAEAYGREGDAFNGSWLGTDGFLRGFAEGGCGGEEGEDEDQ